MKPPVLAAAAAEERQSPAVTPYLDEDGILIYCGNSLELLSQLDENSVQCCVTSPPYWGLRDYGNPPTVWGGESGCPHEFDIERIETEIGKGNWAQAVNGRGEEQGGYAPAIRSVQQRGFCIHCGAWLGCFGLEPTYQLFLTHAVEIFRAVRRVLRPDGTLWLNIGDSYASDGGKGEQGTGELADRSIVKARDDSRGRGTPTKASADSRNGDAVYYGPSIQPNRTPQSGLKPKDLVGIPWRLAFALQADGWYLRSDIIWHKPNPLPESVTDRPTKAHEYIFLLSKSERYYYDMEAIAEPTSPDTHARYARGRSNSHKWKDGGPGGQTIATNKPGSLFDGCATPEPADNGTLVLPIEDFRVAPGVNPKAAKLTRPSGVRANASFSAAISGTVRSTRNKRTVWTIPTQPFPEAHFATFPEDLVTPCILAGARRGDVVMDPFCGAATVAVVARRNGNPFIGLEMNPGYCEIAKRRLRQPMLDLTE